MPDKNKHVFNEKIEHQAKMIIEHIINKGFKHCPNVFFSVKSINGNTHDIRLFLIGGEGPYGTSYDQYTFSLKCKELGVEARYSLITGLPAQEGWNECEYPAALLEEVLELVLRHPLVVKLKLSDKDLQRMCKKINEATKNIFTVNNIHIENITPDFITVSIKNSKSLLYCRVSTPDWTVLKWRYVNFGDNISDFMIY
jgi:hypothetical protein